MNKKSINAVLSKPYIPRLCGTENTIADTEKLRDELIAMAYGIWDYIKNSGEYNYDNWELDWVGFWPGKRESRRYIGDYVMNQNDVEMGGKFDDVVAYGGWSMDDHNPMGIRTREQPTIYHPAPSPFGIPYRCLYSKNINNLFFAGRNISVTHSAMSSTRVMATCAAIGQAVGTAAALAVQNNLSPRGVYKSKIDVLQQTLIGDDCFLPGHQMEISDIMKNAEILTDGEDPELLINGVERQLGSCKNCWSGNVGAYIDIRFSKLEYVEELRIVLDSDLERKTIGGGGYLVEKATIANYPLEQKPVHIPMTLVKDLKIDIMDESGEYEEFTTVLENHQRIIKVKIESNCRGIKIIPLASHGNETVNIFSVTV